MHYVVYKGLVLCYNDPVQLKNTNKNKHYANKSKRND
jgi:hypothetical protein